MTDIVRVTPSSQSLLRVLRSMIPEAQRVVLLADRGFGRTELGRFCQAHGFDQVIRIKPDVCVRCASYTGNLLDYPVHKGICKLLKSVAYRCHHSVTQHIVVRWVRGLCPRQAGQEAELATARRRVLVPDDQPVGRTGADQQALRAANDHRRAVPPRQEQTQRLAPAGPHEDHPPRPSRPAAADPGNGLLAAVRRVGLVALAAGHPAGWTASSKNDCSVFTIGRIMLNRITVSVAHALRALIEATEQAAPNWG
jgi:hypothetical protein